MQDNKYYTPSIEDLRVGYQCEIRQEADSWRSETIDFAELPFSYYRERLELKWLRTAFLTKDQIEAEGWDLSEDSELFYNFEFAKSYEMVVPKNRQMMPITIRTIGIMQTKESDISRIFNGTIHSINELRTLMKLLNIK